jgi:hypothetical protein
MKILDRDNNCLQFCEYTKTIELITYFKWVNYSLTKIYLLNVNLTCFNLMCYDDLTLTMSGNLQELECDLFHLIPKISDSNAHFAGEAQLS